MQNEKIILEKGVIINVQEEHIEKLNDECNNHNNKIESLEIENNILKEQLEDYEPTEELKEENRSRIKELTQKNKVEHKYLNRLPWITKCLRNSIDHKSNRYAIL